MADVLIKGMLCMPTRCEDCLLLDDETGYCKMLNKSASFCKPSSGDCPLVEVPYHGRLIDADKLLPESGYDPEMFKGKYPMDAENKQFQTLMGYEIYNMVEDAPTVLEASE